MPDGVSYRAFQRSGTVRVLRTNVGLICVHSFLKRTSAAAARVCTETDRGLGRRTLRGLAPNVVRRDGAA